MTSESDSKLDNAGRDWSKYMWYVVAAAAVVMIGVLFIPQGEVRVVQTRSHAWHILFEFEGTDLEQGQAALELATLVRKRIVDGEDFEKMAREFSEDTYSGGKGGDLGWLYEGDLTAPVDTYVWEAPLNQISEIIQSSYGFHIVRVTAREIADADVYERELHERVLNQNASDGER